MSKRPSHKILVIAGSVLLSGMLGAVLGGLTYEEAVRFMAVPAPKIQMGQFHVLGIDEPMESEFEWIGAVALLAVTICTSTLLTKPRTLRQLLWRLILLTALALLITWVAGIFYRHQLHSTELVLAEISGSQTVALDFREVTLARIPCIAAGGVLFAGFASWIADRFGRSHPHRI